MARYRHDPFPPARRTGREACASAGAPVSSGRAAFQRLCRADALSLLFRVSVLMLEADGRGRSDAVRCSVRTRSGLPGRAVCASTCDHRRLASKRLLDEATALDARSRPRLGVRQRRLAPRLPAPCPPMILSPRWRTTAQARELGSYHGIPQLQSWRRARGAQSSSMGPGDRRCPWHTLVQHWLHRQLRSATTVARVMNVPTHGVSC